MMSIYVIVAVFFLLVQGSCFGFYHQKSFFGANSRIPVGFFQSFGDDFKLKNLEIKVKSLSSLSSSVTTLSTFLSQIRDDQKQTKDNVDSLENELETLTKTVEAVEHLIDPATSNKRQI